MSFWIWLTGGHSMPVTETAGQRFSLWVGRRLATRHRHCQIDPTAQISPEARINPRTGEIHIGAHTVIALGAIIQGNVTIGAHCSVQAHGNLVGYGDRQNKTGTITIGNHVRIAANCLMIAANHRFENPDQPIHGQGLAHAPITIGDDVWIGGHVKIAAGVTIGRGAVIGMGAVVTHDSPPYAVAVGVPARVIKFRRPEEKIEC
jgi:acetyltransferase-like isoleucine patch superfamily enzyme